MPGIFQNFIAGRQAGMAEQDRARAIEQQAIQNQLLQRQQDIAEQEFAQRQGTYNREQQFNELAAKYLGGEAVQTLGVPTTGGPPAQALDESQGPPQYPPQAAAPVAGPQVPISQLIALDPSRALELENIRIQRKQQQQGQIYNLATRALNSPKPAATFKYLLGADTIGDLNVKSLRDGLVQAGVDINAMDDQQASTILQAIASRSAAAAGIKPEADFTLAQGAQRFTGDGRLIASVPPGPTANDPEDKTFNRANTLRDEYSKQTAPYEIVASGYSKILSAAKEPSAAGDMSLIYGFMKMLDPGSTVREGEYATAEQAGSVPERIVAMYNKALSGERLSPAVRDDFLGQAKKVYKSESVLYRKKRSNYENLARRAKVDPIDVIGNEIQIIPEGTTATGQSGEKVIYKDGEWVPAVNRNGQWVPADAQ